MPRRCRGETDQATIRLPIEPRALAQAILRRLGPSDLADFIVAAQAVLADAEFAAATAPAADLNDEPSQRKGTLQQTPERGTTPMAFTFSAGVSPAGCAGPLTPHARRARKQKPTPPKVRLDIERLEQRWMMTTVQFGGLMMPAATALRKTPARFHPVSLDAASSQTVPSTTPP